MKKIILPIIFTIVTQAAFCQKYILPLDESGRYAEYTSTVEVNNSKDDLFKNAQSWIAKSFGDYKAVVNLEDKGAGRLIVKGTSSVSMLLYSTIKYTLTIDCRDNKYRVLIDNILGDGVSRIGVIENRMLDGYQDEVGKATKPKKIEAAKAKLARWQASNLSMNLKIEALMASLQKAMVGKDEF